jgi:hypothetical protein
MSIKELPGYIESYIKKLPPCKKCGCLYHYGYRDLLSIESTVKIKCDACQHERLVLFSDIL